jgi:dinuclear metal center YbgI/SA1388 family protein
MMILKDVMAVLDTIAPFEGAQEWDNVGLMVGDLESPINSVLVALDPSLEVIHKAKESKIDLLLTHHPLLLKPIARIDLQDVIAKKIAMLILARINLISMHTNLDKAPGGVADELAKRLALNDVRPHGYMRIGFINKPTTLNDWVTALCVRSARLIDVGRDVSMVALCPGSGMEYWEKALSLGCDTFVTGDVRYHAGLDAKEAGMNVVDLGHFGTEEIIVTPLAERLKQELKGVAVNAHHGRDVFTPYNN